MLYILYALNDYPLKKLTLGLVALNPIDLGHIVILLKIDIASLMGYTGALYQQFFGSLLGIVYSLAIMCLWVFIPLWLAKRIFMKKDLQFTPNQVVIYLK